MRIRPRSVPDIEIEPKEEVIEEWGSVEKAHLACLTWEKRNAITILNCAKCDEDSILDTIIHETNHWAQFLYLNNHEVLKIMLKYLAVYHNGECPFIEWINPIPSGYDYSEWEEKYNREFTDLLNI